MSRRILKKKDTDDDSKPEKEGIEPETKPPSPPPVPTSNNRKIKIHVDYDQSDIFVQKMSESNPAVVDLYKMSKRIIANLHNYFNDRLNVTTVPIKAFTKELNCAGIKFKPFNPEIDLYVVVKAEYSEKTSYFAAASSCILDQVSGRPVVGVYFLNLAKMELNWIKEYFYFSTFVHEFTHILGFTNDLFDKYIDPKTGKRLGKKNVAKGNP